MTTDHRVQLESSLLACSSWRSSSAVAGVLIGSSKFGQSSFDDFLEERGEGKWEEVVVLGGVGEVGGDMVEDRKECTEQLTGLATCLLYVQGEAAAPTKDCCRGLKQVVEKSGKCLCILIKYSTDPNLRIKNNTSLTAKLPHSCSASVDILYYPV
ncbi:hypothetical protein AMTRI_Chr04g245950 [Amborella trichopoda]|uniref:Bifunctional inhibitor/plant lipid transfer protein/seed storage helical domain-containing protein n=1 Tax=Amborella trichopoda TaxID=13333 RepID=W1NUC5_AMBTC|nr:hypothetical protein AMTR_s00236p00023830 [Amborella trichopoda]